LPVIRYGIVVRRTSVTLTGVEGRCGGSFFEHPAAMNAKPTTSDRHNLEFMV
jgi:hypothetical protein